MPAISVRSVIERERNIPIRDVFEDAGRQLVAVSDLAKNLGVTMETLRIWMKDEGFETFYGVREKR